MVRSYFITGIIALALGIGIGVYLGWVQFPTEYRNSHMCQLDISYQEEYTLMVARGYRKDGDVEKSIERLQALRVTDIPACDDGRPYQINNIPDWVRYLTEQYISDAADRRDISDLVALYAAYGELPDIMESFRPVDNP
jgi:hypothetical protein